MSTRSWLAAFVPAWLFRLLLCSSSLSRVAGSQSAQISAQNIKSLQLYRQKLLHESQLALGAIDRIQNSTLTQEDIAFIRMINGKMLYASQLADPDNGLSNILEVEDASSMQYPWFADQNQHAYPLPILCIMILSALLIMFVWESLWLRTTLLRNAKRIWDKASENLTIRVEHSTRQIVNVACSLEQSVVGGLFSDERRRLSSSSTTKQTEELKKEKEPMNNTRSWSKNECCDFWQAMDDWRQVEDNWNCKKLRKAESLEEETTDIVRFSQRAYHVYETDGKVTIGVQRIGRAADVVKVKVETEDKPGSGSSSNAMVGKNFEHMDKEIIFQPDEHFQTFDVPILSNDAFDPARWFQVRIAETSGNVSMEAPTSCRVYISDDYHFPANIPKAKRSSSFWRMAYFIKECKDVRGIKFWKTMAAMLYFPWHNVVVTSLVQKFMIDWAAQPESVGTDSWRAIVSLATLQFISTALLRWADVVQTRNRGRTGGIRQWLRLHLLEKMLMLANEDQWTYTGAAWFYSAIHDVDGVTLDIYWQVFKSAQDLWGLIISVACLVVLSIQGSHAAGTAFDPSQLLPTIAFLVMCPVAVIWIVRRTPVLAKLVLERKIGECAWMEVFSWLSHTRCLLYGFSPLELVQIEVRFKSENSKFMKPHQAARDYTNDTRWTTLWLCSTAYCVILMWGAFSLFAEREGSENQGSTLTAGEYVLLLKLFHGIGKYVVRLNDGLVNFLRGEVSLDQVERLMNGTKRDRFGIEREMEAAVLEKHAKGEMRHKAKGETIVEKRDAIYLTGVEFHPDKTGGVGPFGGLSLTQKVSFPLGSVVRVAGSDEAARLTFLATIAGVIIPSVGEVIVPLVAERVMVPPLPVTLAGRLKVCEVFQLAGATKDDAVHLANVFGLDPGWGSEHLPPGSLQLVMIGRALLRDPEILVMSRPLAYAPVEVRTRVASVLRLWQSSGGLEALLARLRTLDDMSKLAESGDVCEVPVQDMIRGKMTSFRSEGGSLRPKRIPVRTLVICEEDLPGMSTSEDIRIDLDKLTGNPGYLDNPLLCAPSGWLDSADVRLHEGGREYLDGLTEI